MMDSVMHSYTFRAYPLHEAFASARRFGWEGLELQPCHFDRDQIDTELPAAIKMGIEQEILVRCVDFGGDFITDDAAAREEAIHRAEHEIEVCGQNGVRLMNGGVGSLVVDRSDYGMNGSALAKDIHYERAAEAFRHLGALAAQHSITLVFEIHMNALHDTIASTVRLLDLIGLDNVLANPDVGNMFATSTAEKDPAALDMLDGRIGYFHLKNCEVIAGTYNYSVRLADGHIDIYKWFEKLLQMGYNGPLCIEYCGAGDPHVAAEQDLLYARRCLEFLGE
ncbi:MAG: Sugar phosphate isomerase/epimerase [Candidatus Hydrogenedentes bacterium]|nr:Sugar phosphate isomerase/epimerase [Candidatus Hydrogenedentota bacterium]